MEATRILTDAKEERDNRHLERRIGVAKGKFEMPDDSGEYQESCACSIDEVLAFIDASNERIDGMKVRKTR
jgi:hypothetical protein